MQDLKNCGLPQEQSPSRARQALTIVGILIIFLAPLFAKPLLGS